MARHAAVRDEAEAWDRHILDSAALLPILQDAASSFRSPKLRVLDVGSGAGLPGIVLALLMPLWQVTFPSWMSCLNLTTCKLFQASLAYEHGTWP